MVCEECLAAKNSLHCIDASIQVHIATPRPPSPASIQVHCDTPQYSGTWCSKFFLPHCSAVFFLLVASAVNLNHKTYKKSTGNCKVQYIKGCSVQKERICTTRKGREAAICGR